MRVCSHRRSGGGCAGGRSEAQHDDYTEDHGESDCRPSGGSAFAEYLHERVRKVYWGYAPNESLSNDELIRENYCGIRPAPVILPARNTEKALSGSYWMSKTHRDEAHRIFRHVARRVGSGFGTSAILRANTSR